MRAVRLALVALLAQAVQVTHAQQYAFTQFTPREGLAQSQVRCIAQDAQGYLWFGTLGGASRFDGHSFTNYALQEGLPDAQVNAMLATSDGTLWLAAGSSLAEFDGQRMRSVPKPKAANSARILALAESDDHRLIIATEGSGVFSRNINDAGYFGGLSYGPSWPSQPLRTRSILPSPLTSPNIGSWQ